MQPLLISKLSITHRDIHNNTIDFDFFITQRINESQNKYESVILCSDRNFYEVNIRLFVNNILSVQTYNIGNIFLQLVNKTADCFNNIVFILLAKISFKIDCEKMENNSKERRAVAVSR